MKNRFLLRLKNQGFGLFWRHGASELGRDLILSSAFAAHIDVPLESLGQFELRGLSGEHEAFTTAERAHTLPA